MLLRKIKKPLEMEEIPTPTPLPHEVLIRVHCCGLCRTDLHVIDGELPYSKLPLVLGHQIVGTIVALGSAVTHLKLDTRVGVPWLGGSCNHCVYCDSHRENLCDEAIYTGYQKNGGLAEFCVADARSLFLLPENLSDEHVAPLLCGGLIGYRALKMTEGAQKVGLYGFGSSAHLVIQLLKFQQREAFVFTREKDKQQFAKELGATWVGRTQDLPQAPLDAAIIFAPVGAMVPLALRAVGKGGVVVCAGIHMSDIPSFPYALLWEERILRSVANLTHQDGLEFLPLASRIPITSKVSCFPLAQANEAIKQLRKGNISGSIVIKIS